MHRFAFAVLVAASMLCSLHSFADQPISTEIENLPLQIVEGDVIKLSVSYDVAQELGEVQMHVEMKNTAATVLNSQTAMVAGTGDTQVQFRAPSQQNENRIAFAIWYGTDWRQAIVPILRTAEIPILTKQEGRVLQAQQRAAENWREQHQQQLAEGPSTAVMADQLPGFDNDLAARVIAALSDRGLRVLQLTADEVSNPFILSPQHFHTLVLPTSRVYPVGGYRALTNYLAQGGNVIALGAPALETPVKKVQGTWMGAQQMKAVLAGQEPERILWDFETGSPDDWGHTSGGGSPADWELAAPGADNTGHALHCVIPDFRNWNTFAAPDLEQPPTEDQTLTCLWAKGGPDTISLALEWREDDGSRWIATIPLGSHWQYYAVSSDEFRYWHDSDAEGRGGPNDRLRPDHAVQFTVGLAMTHTTIPSGRHEFWVDEIGVAKSPLGDTELPQRPNIQPIEMLCPAYKFHKVSAPSRTRVSEKQCIIPPADLPGFEEGLKSVHPRPQGTGFNKERKWRWIPLIESFDASDRVCGTPACMVINRTGRFQGSIVTSFALPDPAYDDPQLLDMIAGLAARIKDGFFLFEGGAEYYAYFQDETVTLGATTIATGDGGDRKCSIRLTVESDDGPEFQEQLQIADGTAQCQWQPEGFKHRTYQVTCELLDEDGSRLDLLKHPLVVWQPPEDPHYVQYRDGHFYLDDKRWLAHGVNYMPSSGMAIEDGPYFEYWMDKQPYDPVVIERDLQRIKQIGLNSVSIFCYYRSLDSRNLLDILERCRRHNLMVNLSLRPGTPMHFRWQEMKALIETYRLAEHDIIFAYDLAWEPTFGGYDARRQWDPQWQQWIIERYGSIANAEESWGVPVPRADGAVTGPSNDQLTYDGDYRVMVCAYRRFLDDLLAKRHAQARRLVQSIDPNHLISFRMRRSGDPDLPPGSIAYDFKGLARSCHIMEPEGYGRIGDWERVRRGMFTADYARCMAPDKPVMWAEFGYSCWNRENMQPDRDRQEWTGDFYDRFYRMCHQSDVDGTMCWFYPGGFRVGENSDYGIINPDGTWRPTTWTINKWADEMTGSRPQQPVDVWLRIDRDATVKGVVGVYEAIEDQYWRLRSADRNPGLRPDGWGLDSANAPDMAVGNVPYVFGKTPHKYLNAEFDTIEIKNHRGEWQTVEDGSVVEIEKGEPVLVRATIGNIGVAKWLAAEGEGQVILTCGEAFKPIPQDVPYMGTVRVEDFQVCELSEDMDLTFEMGVWPDVQFGEKISITARIR